jgi:hypothetical protein
MTEKTNDRPGAYPAAYEARGPNGEKIVPSADRSHLVNAKTGARWVTAPAAGLAAPSPSPMLDTTTYTLRDPNSLALHPCLDGMPELATDDPKFASLVADVRDRGFDYPAIIDEQDRVIDGRHRRRIAILLGIELPTVCRAGADASEIILSTLLQRRHYPKGALAYMAAPLFADVVEAGRARRLANLQVGDSRKVTQYPVGKTTEQLAEELGFSVELYKQAKKVREFFADDREREWPGLERPTTAKRYFEPQILSGDIGLGGVIQALSGKMPPKGKRSRCTPPMCYSSAGSTICMCALRSIGRNFRLTSVSHSCRSSLRRSARGPRMCAVLCSPASSNP